MKTVPSSPRHVSSIIEFCIYQTVITKQIPREILTYTISQPYFETLRVRTLDKHR